MIQRWIIGYMLSLGLIFSLLLPSVTEAQSMDEQLSDDSTEAESDSPFSSRNQRLIDLMDAQQQIIDNLARDEDRISSQLRKLQQYARERTRLEERISRENIVISRLEGLQEVIRGQIAARNRRLLNLQASGNIIEVTQTTLMDLATQLNDPVRRDVRLAQAEEQVVAIRDSLIQIIPPKEVDKLAENDFDLALDWYLKAQYKLVEPLLKDFVEAYPNALSYDQAMLMLGDIYQYQSRLREGEEIFITLTTNETTTNDVKLLSYALLQDIYYRQGRWDDSIAAYQAVADQFLLYPEEYDGAIYLGGECYIQKALAGISKDTDVEPGPLSDLQIAQLDSAVAIFQQVSDFSPVYILAQQQIAQCYIEQNRLEDAINPLLNAESARPPLWADDIIFESIWLAMARLGHVYIELARKAEAEGIDFDSVLRYRNMALDQYSKVPQESLIYDEVLLSLAWLEIEKNNTENAVRLLEHLLDVRPDSQYSYEAWITLGDGYTRLRDYEQAEEVFSQLAVTERAVTLIDSSVNESHGLDEVRRELHRLAVEVETDGDLESLENVSDQLDSLAEKKMRMLELHRLIFESDPMALERVNYGEMKTALVSLSGLVETERTALNVVSSRLSVIERQAQTSVRTQDTVSKIRQDNRKVGQTQSIAAAFERDLNKGLSILESIAPQSFDRWLKEAAFGKVNIEFTKYQTYKNSLLAQYEQIGTIQRQMEVLPEDDAILADVEEVLMALAEEAEQIEAILSGTRRELVVALDQVVQRYPDSQSVEPMLFQLAEVQYDQTEREFLEANEAYAAAFDSGEELGDAPLPDYRKPIQTYERLIREYPNSEFVDQSLFQLGHLLGEEGDLDRSNRMFEQLVERFPESTVVPEAYLRIGDYYFDSLFLGNTNLSGGELMRRAIAAYNRVLEYPSNRNFQSALYKLGWAYYNLAAPQVRMEEYDHSIRYFTYLLEDSLRVAEYKEIAAEANIVPAQLDPGYNLTSEAVKYIAINFRDRVETGLEDERRNWVSVPSTMKDYILSLGTDKPYSKSLMLAVADVYRETGQVEGEVTALDSLLTLFPNDPQAPQTMQRIIEGYDRLNDMIEVDPEVWDITAHNGETPEAYLNRARERLFRDYGREWAETLDDTTARVEALELADQAGWRLANYVASLVESGQDRTAGIDRAAQYYEDYSNDFPDTENAYTARWNVAQYMWRLENFDEAYDQFISVSRDPKFEKHRKQAALNAILAAEKLLDQEQQSQSPLPTTEPAGLEPSESSDLPNP